ETLAPAQPTAELPVITAEQLLAFRISGRGEQRVRIEGVVTAAFPRNEIFLRQGDLGFGVRLVQSAEVSVGDHVAVVGFPEMERFSALVVDAEVVQRTAGEPLAPLDVADPDTLEIRRGVPLDGMLVSLMGTLRDVFRADGGITLLVAGSKRTLYVRVPEGTPIPLVILSNRLPVQ
ncbi:MAG: hypothetical protein V4773_02595, partial [Verrucomicrobiota bacterium]